MRRNFGNAGKIIKITPPHAIAGGEVYLECENFPVRSGGDLRCYFGDEYTSVGSASANRVVTSAPAASIRTRGKIEVSLFSDGEHSQNSIGLTAAELLAEDLHQVANPAFDPNENALVVTRSGSRGQQLPVTLFRLLLNGDLEDISGDVMNPTGIAFDPSGAMFVTSRAEGVVYRINRNDEAVPFASDLGIATGIAFDRDGNMFVGDRAGTVYKINSIGESRVFAALEQSIAAYHLAFGVDNRLYVTRPNVASFDSILRIDEDGEVSTFYRGLGRPQGLAFDRDGNLYVAGCLRERRGIIRVSPGGDAELFVAGMNIVGLCFGKNGEMFVATNDSIFRLDVGIYGTLV